MRTWSKPKALRTGDLIGIAAPSGAVRGDLLARGVSELESLGFRTRVVRDVGDRLRFAAGTPERRVAELYELFADPEVKAVFCARGGAGAISLMDRLEAERLGEGPKIFVGCSDITFLHRFFQARGWVTFHGPMVAGDLARGTYDRDSLLSTLMGEGAPFATQEDDLVALRQGSARGRLLGGCLSILASSAGTPWALLPEGEPVLLFLEDVDEPPYRIDRMLRQLRASRAFDGVLGVVFGDMKGCSPKLSADFSLTDVILDALGDLEIPVALGLSSGHVSGSAVTLPMGVQARLTVAGEARLEILEAAVS